MPLFSPLVTPINDPQRRGRAPRCSTAKVRKHDGKVRVICLLAFCGRLTDFGEFNMCFQQMWQESLDRSHHGHQASVTQTCRPASLTNSGLWLSVCQKPSESTENQVKHRRGCKIFVKDVLIKIPTPLSQNVPSQGVIVDAKHECNWVTFAGSVCVYACVVMGVISSALHHHRVII